MNPINTELVEVTKTPRSTALAADAAADATELLVTNAAVFDQDDGDLGGLEVGETDYVYTSVDVDTGTITLHEDTPLLADADAGDAVQLLTAAGEPAQKWQAWVLVDDGDLPIPVTIGGEWLDKFREGTEQAGMTVAIEEDGDGYRVAGQSESPPIRSGEFDDPETTPVGGSSAPTEAPAEVVTLKVVGDATGLNIYADGAIAPSTELDYYIDGVLFDSTQSRVVRREADAAGVPMVDADPGTTWSIHVVPRNIIDEGTPSDPAAAGLNPGVTSEILASLVAAIRVVADAVEVGAGSWTEENGLHIPIAAGGGLFHVPNNGDPIQMLGVVLQAFSAVFSGDVTLQGETTLEGTQTAAVGVTKPATAPSLSIDWPTPTQLGVTSGETIYGATIAGGKIHLALVDRIQRSDLTTGAFENNVWYDDGSPNTSRFHGSHGAVLLGGRYYVLGWDYGRNARYVYVYDETTEAKVDEWAAPLTGVIRDARIHANSNSASSIRITHWVKGTDPTPRLISQAYNLTGGTSGSPLTINTSGVYEILGVYYGFGDFGATRLVVARDNGAGSRVNLVYDASGNLQENFDMLTGQRTIAWDSGGGWFYGLTTTGKVYQFAGVQVADTPAATYTRRNVAGGYETEASPAASLARPARRWLKITTPATDADADAIAVYINNHRQTDPAAGVTTVLIGNPTTGGAAAPLTNTFPDAPGKLQSEADTSGEKTWHFDGDGSWRAGRFAGNADGTNANDTGYQPISLGADWAQDGSVVPAVRNKDGVTYFRGAVARAAAGSNTIGTIDAEYRPPASRTPGARVGTAYIPLTVGSGGSLAVSGYTNGTVVQLDAIAPFPNVSA